MSSETLSRPARKGLSSLALTLIIMGCVVFGTTGLCLLAMMAPNRVRAPERGPQPTVYQAMVVADEFFDRFLSNRDEALVQRSREVTAQTIALDGKNTPVWAHSSLVSEGKSIDEQGPQRVFMLYYANSRLVAYRDGSGGVVPKTSRRFNFGGGEMSAP